MNESVVEDIKSRIDLAELIASYGVEVKRAGSSQKACCPFHNEKTPSFNINASRGFYHCFGCGESGDAIKFVQKMEGLSFPEALKKLADRCGVVLDERGEDPEAGKRRRLMALMTELAAFYRRCLLKAKEAELARAYLVKRELTGEVGDDWLIGYAPKGAAPICRWAEKYGYTPAELEAAGVIKPPNRPGDAGYHRFGGRLMFSVRDRQGRVVAFSGRELEGRKNTGKYVNSPETAIFKKSKVLFGFDRAAGEIARSPHREVIACEGQIDCIRLHLNGFRNAVASQGTAFTEEHAKMLKRVCDSMVLVYDDDAAGHKATIRVAGMMLALEVPVRVVSLPDGDDPDSFLRTKGAEAFRSLVDAAESIVAFQCRVERAKERNSESIDAVSRISRAVLATVACCRNAILRASMIQEAASLLNLPAAALRDELGKVKPASEFPAPAEEEAGAAEGEVLPHGEGTALPLVGEEAAAVEPPSALEFALLEFLLANEGTPEAAELDQMAGEFLPRRTLPHDFAWKLTAAWRQAAVGRPAALDEFAAALSPLEREWFDRVRSGAGRTLASTEGAAATMENFVRKLWEAELKRERGRLPAQGDAAAEVRRLELTAYIKRLNMIKWHDVKELIRGWS